MLVGSHLPLEEAYPNPWKLLVAAFDHPYQQQNTKKNTLEYTGLSHIVPINNCHFGVSTAAAATTSCLHLLPIALDVAATASDRAGSELHHPPRWHHAGFFNKLCSNQSLPAFQLFESKNNMY
jgi:hypothetical protein